MRIWHWARNGVVISLATHVAMVVASSHVMLDLSILSNDVALSAILSNDDADDLTFEISTPPESSPLELDTAAENAGAMGLAAAVSVQLAETPVELITSLMAADVPAAGKEAAADQKPGSGSGKGLTGDGNGGNGTSFFGRKAAAKSVAFVIDASSSMTGPRFVRALSELDSSLSQLKEDQKFYVAFFTDQTFPMFWPQSQFQLLPATKPNLFRVRSWLRRCRSQGGTGADESTAPGVEDAAGRCLLFV